MITDDVNNILLKHGIVSLRKADTNKKIRKAEENFKNMGLLYSEIYSKPFLRFILQAISKEGEFLSFNELQKYILSSVENGYIERTLKESPVKRIKCKRCNESIYCIESDNLNTLPFSITCLKCKCQNYEDTYSIEEDWDIDSNTLEKILDKLIYINAIYENYQIYCVRCTGLKRFTPIDVTSLENLGERKLLEYIKTFYCPRCKNLGTAQQIFALDESLFHIWTTGLWLESYIYNILLNSGLKFNFITQGVLARKENKEEVNIDVLILHNDKVISIECKDIRIDNKAKKGDVDQILKLVDISDIIVFITTTEIESDTKRNLESVSKKLTPFLFVEGKDIETLPEILLKSIERKGISEAHSLP